MTTTTSTVLPTTNATEIVANIEAVSNEILKLDDKANLKAVIAKINEIVESLQSSKPTRNRGPESTRDMTDDNARRIMLTDLKDKSHKDCATTLGLSYGQIYSARGGYTFKAIYKEANKK